MILVSACLVGLKCRYDGDTQANEFIIKLVDQGLAHPVCPEQLGGLCTPREPCEIQKKAEGTLVVMTKEGMDCTQAFELGAKRTLAIAHAVGARMAILKAKSPSCGKNQVYDGTFTSTLISGSGLTAQLLMDYGIKVFSEKEELDEALFL
jgi:uncharacterized protein YbbK (DUF523 family)